jgi:hypothetical protein
MVTVSLSVDDLDTIIQGLEGDFYVNGTPEQEAKFWLHLKALRGRLSKILEKEKKLQELNAELRHVQFCISHGVGYSIDEGFAKIDKIMEEMKKVRSGDKKNEM